MKYTDKKYFYFDKKKWNITWYSNNWPKSVIIPSKIDWITVKKIWDFAFKNNNLTNVNIPNSVIKIWTGAFENNNLISVNIPNSVTKICNSAFQNNKLTSVIIPKFITEIWDNAFAGNILISVNLNWLKWFNQKQKNDIFDKNILNKIK